MSTLFFNRMPNSLSLSIEDDLSVGTISFVSDRNDTSDGIVCVQYTKATVELNDDLQVLESGRFVGRIFTFICKGSVRFMDEIRQTGSTWDSEEAVYGISHDWTKSGLFCINVKFDDFGRLINIWYNTEYPFVNPQGQDAIQTNLGVKYEANPWGYTIQRVGENIWTGICSGTTWRFVCHKILKVDQEPLSMMNEVDIPVYMTGCDQCVGNEIFESPYTSFFPNIDDWNKNYNFVSLCPVCFPPK